MRSILAISTLISSSIARTNSRDYDSRDYYAIQIGSEQDLPNALHSIGARLEHALGELENHYLVSTLKNQAPIISKRDTQFKFLEHQTPRQRHKRTVLPRNCSPDTCIAKRDEGDDPSLVELMQRTREDFNIQDPMFTDQWHLLNTRNRGHDINVTGVWAQNITGDGAVVALVDDGIDMNSQDLASNYYAEGSYDFNDHNSIPSPKLFDDYHGTRCAGEIAAVRNDICGVGIAYNGKVSGLRILSGRITDVDEAISLNYDFEHNQIYSCSWGPPDDGRAMEGPGVLIRRAMVNGIQHGRGGKGSIFVFASGNGAVFDDNCNFDGYTNSIFSITIGGIDRLDLHPYYSELCAPQLAVTYSSGSGDYIHTTDVGENACSDRHGGTSAAAPIGAGIFALVLSVRPDLTWRDLQHLVVQTAVPVNLDDGDWKSTSAGFKFNHKFGYGKLDAYAIVEKAKSWQLVKAQSWYHSPSVIIDETLGTEPHQQITSYFDITQEMLSNANLARVEHITVTVNIDHQRRGDVTVDLASPDGVLSNLATVRRYDDSTEGFQNWTFMTVKHWGESGIGQWRLIVGDHDNPEQTGLFKNWRMTLWGEAIDESKAVALLLPGEEDEISQDHGEVTGPAHVSTVEPVVKPTPTSGLSEIMTPARPVISVRPPTTIVHQPIPTTIIQPLPDENEVLPTKFDWISRRVVWLYVAVATISTFIVGIGVWLFVQKRRTSKTTKESYEFKELRSNTGRANVEPAGELYDAFAVNDSDDDDAGSRDSLDEMRPLRPNGGS